MYGKRGSVIIQKKKKIKKINNSYNNKGFED